MKTHSSDFKKQTSWWCFREHRKHEWNNWKTNATHLSKIFRAICIEKTFVSNAFSAYDHFTRHTDNDNTLDDNKIWMMTMMMRYLNFRESSTRVFAYVLHSEKRVESANARAWTEFCSSNYRLTLISENKQIFKFLNHNYRFSSHSKPTTHAVFSLLIIGLNLKIDPSSSPTNLWWVES